MPFGDGTGPLGMGPMTGRAAGYCAGYSVPGYMNPTVFGRGRGFWGRGRGWRHWYYATGLPFWARSPYSGYATPYYQGMTYPPVSMSKEDRLNALRDQAEMLQKNLEDINTSISELEQGEQESK